MELIFAEDLFNLPEDSGTAPMANIDQARCVPGAVVLGFYSDAEYEIQLLDEGIYDQGYFTPHGSSSRNSNRFWILPRRIKIEDGEESGGDGDALRLVDPYLYTPTRRVRSPGANDTQVRMPAVFVPFGERFSAVYDDSPKRITAIRVPFAEPSTVFAMLDGVVNTTTMIGDNGNQESNNAIEIGTQQFQD